jgi:hypothetical protein
MPDYGRLSRAMQKKLEGEKGVSGVLGYEINGEFKVISEDPKKFYVRFPNGNFVAAYHFNRVVPSPGMPVKVAVDRVGNPVIIGMDTQVSGMFSSSSSGSNVGLHDHVRGSGLEFIIDSWMLKQLRVSPDTGLLVEIAAGPYMDGDELKWFPADSIDLTSYLPSSLLFRKWVIVGINPDTGAIVVGESDEYDVDDGADPADIPLVEFTENGWIPLVAIPLVGEQTSIPNYSVQDLRMMQSRLAQFLNDLANVEASGYEGYVLTYRSGLWVAEPSQGGSGTDDDAIHINVSDEFDTATQESSPAIGDRLLIESAANGFAKRYVEIDDLPGGADTDAIHINVSDEFDTASQKAIPISADRILIEDSAAGYAKKWSEIGDLPGISGSSAVDLIKTVVTTLETTASTSFAAIDSVNIGFTQHQHSLEVGDIVECVLEGQFYNNGATTYMSLDLEIDQPTSSNIFLSNLTGTPVTNGHYIQYLDGNRRDSAFVFTFIATEAGLHQFRPVWRTHGGTAEWGNDNTTGMFQTHKLGGSGSGSGGGGIPDIILRDEKASGSSGGTFTSGAWRTRTLNTEVRDINGDCTLSSDQFTLAAGTYYIYASAPGYSVNRHQARLYNVTDSAMVADGEGKATDSLVTGGGATQTDSEIWVVLTTDGTKTYRLEHRCESTSATFGFGIDNTFGEQVVYSVVLIWKAS